MLSFCNHSMDFYVRPRKWKLEMRAFHFCYLNINIIFGFLNYFDKHLRNIGWLQILFKIQYSIYVLNTSRNNSENGTYASLAFISGVGHTNPSSGCKMAAFGNRQVLYYFSKNQRLYILCNDYVHKLENPKHNYVSLNSTFRVDNRPKHTQNLALWGCDNSSSELRR